MLDDHITHTYTTATHPHRSMVLCSSWEGCTREAPPPTPHT